MDYDENIQDIKINRMLNKIKKDSELKIKNVEKDVEKRINTFNLKEEKVLDDLISNGEEDIQKKYENLKIEAKY